MTWAEFKAEMERQGAKDEDKIEYIDVDPGWDFTVIRTADGGLMVS